MADPKTNDPSTRQLPSTFQQVLENMRNLQEVVLPKIDMLDHTIFNPDWNKPPEEGETAKPSDVVMDVDQDTMKVVGVSVLTESKDSELKPSDYLRDITIELKKATVIKLNGRTGITKEYVTLLTVRIHDSEVTDYPAWQAAFGDVAMATYFRQEIDDDEWSSWVGVSRKQVIDSSIQPKDQEEGDFWLEPLMPDSDYVITDVDTGEIIAVSEEFLKNYTVHTVESGKPDAEDTTGGYVLGPSGEDYVEEE